VSRTGPGRTPHPPGRIAGTREDGTGPLNGRYETVATYSDYASAQRAVDYLADARFPVERTAIVGTDLRLVEKVVGRMTMARAALAGAGSGAWFGLFIGLLLAIFAVSAWWQVLLLGVAIGALWGGVFGAVAHAATRGRRDFSSARWLEAGQYALCVDVEYAGHARQLVGYLNAG
jgi:hypothetical protein